MGLAGAMRGVRIGHTPILQPDLQIEEIHAPAARATATPTRRAACPRIPVPRATAHIPPNDPINTEHAPVALAHLAAEQARVDGIDDEVVEVARGGEGESCCEGCVGEGLGGTGGRQEAISDKRGGEESVGRGGTHAALHGEGDEGELFELDGLLCRERGVGCRIGCKGGGLVSARSVVVGAAIIE